MECLIASATARVQFSSGMLPNKFCNVYRFAFRRGMNKGGSFSWLGKKRFVPCYKLGQVWHKGKEDGSSGTSCGPMKTQGPIDPRRARELSEEHKFFLLGCVQDRRKGSALHRGLKHKIITLSYAPNM